MTHPRYNTQYAATKEIAMIIIKGRIEDYLRSWGKCWHSDVSWGGGGRQYNTISSLWK